MAGKVRGGATNSALSFCGTVLIILGIFLPLTAFFYLVGGNDFLFIDATSRSFDFGALLWVIVTALLFVVPGLICKAISEALFWLQKINLNSTRSSE